jgi:hypothetical protein
MIRCSPPASLEFAEGAEKKFASRFQCGAIGMSWEVPQGPPPVAVAIESTRPSKVIGIL